MKYTLIRSGRRTLAVEIVRGGEIIVRAPYKMSLTHIEKFLNDNESRILKASERAKNATPSYSCNDIEADVLIKRANETIPSKVAYYSNLMGVKPQSVRITSAQKRFGSCSNKESLCFSFNLMQYPEEAIDYVIVHELAHLIELNHSKSFWNIVERYMPDYKARKALLKN